MDQDRTIDGPNFWDDPAVVGEPIDLLSILGIFLSRGPFILLTTLLCGVLAFGISLLLTPQFTSKALFLPPSTPSASPDNPLALILKTPSSTIYLGLLRSDSVLDEVITSNNLQSLYKAKDITGARTALVSATALSSDTNGFVTLQVTNKDPRLARDIAASYLVALTHLDDRLALNEAAQHRRLFQSQLEKAKNDLEASEIALENAQKSSGVVSPESQTRSGLTAIDTVRAEIRARQVALAALLQAETDQSPDVIRARSEIAAEQAQLGSLENGSSTGPGSGLSAAQAPSVNLKFIQLERDVKYNQVLFDIMAKQFENARLAESSAAPSVQVVDYPEIPLKKSGPARRLFAVVGAAVGFAGSLFLVFFLNRLRALNADPERSRSMRILRSSMAAPRFRP
jgi:uncharacterized protein involved in exopolysaccharide biosynthesis